MGHVLTPQGMQPDPAKIEVVTKMSNPTVNRRLTDKEAHSEWQPHHAEAFNKIKQAISSAPILKYFDINEDATTQCDASESGLATRTPSHLRLASTIKDANREGTSSYPLCMRAL